MKIEASLLEIRINFVIIADQILLTRTIIKKIVHVEFGRDG
mgnify:CR=1 FL=1